MLSVQYCCRNLKTFYNLRINGVERKCKIVTRLPVSTISGELNPQRPNNDLSQSSHCDLKALSVSEVKRIENMITRMKFY